MDSRPSKTLTKQYKYPLKIYIKKKKKKKKKLEKKKRKKNNLFDLS
jgi:hypothetical protein